MSPVESVLFWLSAVIYALTTGVCVYSAVFGKTGALRYVTGLTALGFIIHSGAIVARRVATGHLPWSGDYENSLLGGWLIILFLLAVMVRRKDLRLLAIAVLPFTVLLMGYGGMSNPVLTPLNATLKTVWLSIHVYFAMISFGAYTIGMGTGVLYLLKVRAAATGKVNQTLLQMPSVEKLDELTFRYLLFGFITDAFMIAAGAIWAKDLWGSYWSWDPVETWSLISWLVYGLAIHLRITMGWRGDKFAWIAIAALSTVLVTYFGVNFFVESSLHVFNAR